ncbi:hypothetical protein [Sporosarcina sp. P29]|uniref:hypothetical protein n=1 Tax=Sporosarcina sp. P29 TaxID=2048252 RepID=UPI000C16E118|nr:hypothetical protein [Sporosarcina sp. P29]PIC98818.1 hypothetical protein CSV68_11320 [Sporosarcina sp. P29]
MRESILFFPILLIILIVGCSKNNSEELNKNDLDAVVKEESKEEQQLKIVDDYKRILEEGNEESIFFDYYTTFTQTGDYTNRSDEIIEVYNLAVESAFQKSKDDFYKNEYWFDYSIIEDSLNEKIINFRKQEIENITNSMKYPIMNGEYTKAKEAYSRFIKNESTDAMYEYAKSKELDETGYVPSNPFVNISPFYDGVLSDEILDYASAINGSLGVWIERYNSINSRNLDIVKIEIKNPTLGMSKDEVLKSTWGEPDKVNRTVTSYSQREQWVYPNYKYLYFTDEILTAFQD